MKKFEGKYSIGLDIGTGSVGWVAVDDNYELLKFRGQEAIGVSKFNTADTAEARRLKRGMRRRYNRRIKRIQMLQELFYPLIEDENFFRISETNHKWRNNNEFENRTLSETLRELGYSKEDIHNEFPTIYHLRDYLIQNKGKQDLKLVYLAIHNLVKSRGHFLLNINNWEQRESGEDKEGIEEFFLKLYELNSRTETVSSDFLNKITEIISNTKLTNNDKSKEIQKLIPKEIKDIGKLLVGLKANLFNVFSNSENVDELKEAKLNIKLSDDSEEVDLSLLTDDQEQLIELAKSIYLDATLKEVLQDYDYVAKAKVEDFKNNKRQLKLLKDLIRDHYGEEDYRAFFITAQTKLKEYNEKPSKDNLKKLSYFDQYRLSKKDGKDKFMGEIKKLLKNNLDDAKADKKRENILQLVTDENYLTFLNNVTNSSIPYQNSLYEAKKIIENQMKHHPKLTKEIKDKVVQLISFRIPYYIGPLEKTEGKSEFAWSTRLKDENITPFNFDEVMDKAESAAAFIKRMTNKCTYLISEDVLPKHSLLYQEMEVRNELNGINLRKADEQTGRNFRLDIDERENVYQNLFKYSKKVTHKSLKEFLKKTTNGYENKNVYGTQKENEFASSLSTYNDFRNILGKEKLDNHINEVEYVVGWLTVFNEKEIIKEKIRDNFQFISEDELEKIVKLNYSGWGRLSKKSLSLECNNASIIDLMRKEDYNFMEAYTSIKHGFKEEFERINKVDQAVGNKIRYEDIEELKCSPALKKSIWNSVQIVEELVDIFGNPKNIIIEFAREEGEKKRTVEWKNYWDNLVKENDLMKNEEFKGMFEDLSSCKDNLNYKLEKLKLYLMQGGKCLYTLEKIDLKTLLTESAGNSYYEVDHILPRNFVKDDSFDNKALVVKSANQRKSGSNMPLSIAGSKKGSLIRYWNLLASNKMMSGRKMSRLMKEEFSDEDKEKFIARQLVETRQIAVHVRNLLEERFSTKVDDNRVNVEVMKAGIVSEVRQKLDFPKIRELNDYHHAIDALLIASTFNYGEEIMPNLFKFDFRKNKAINKWKQLNEDKSGEFNSELFLTSSMKKKECRNGKTFAEILTSIISDVTPLVTKKVENTESAFYKESIFSPKEKVAKYVSGKSQKFVHDEVKNSHSVLISYYVKSSKGSLKYKSTIVNVTNLEKLQNIHLTELEEAEFYAKKAENSSEIEKPKIHLVIRKGDIVYIQDNPFYFVSNKEMVNAKQLNINFDLQKRLKKQLNKWNYEVEMASEIFVELATEVVDQYRHILPKADKAFETKKELILGYFENTDKTHEDFVKSVNELLRVSFPSPIRSDKLGGRFTTSASFIVENGKYFSSSITGLKFKKPKSLIKFLEN